MSNDPLETCHTQHALQVFSAFMPYTKTWESCRCSVEMVVVQLPQTALRHCLLVLHVPRISWHCAGHGLQQEEEDGQAEAGDGASQEAGPAQEA